MWALFQKEVSGFFSTVTGYVVLGVFLLVNGLLIWVFPWGLNILDGGYASLSSMFQLAPWILLFLIPAITMQSFSLEKKEGTLDLLFTRPVSLFQIVMAKYLASLLLTLIALLLTGIYYVSLILLGNPINNIDHGATLGSYAGLFLLGSSYAAIGIFTSSLSQNNIVAFILGVFICSWLYTAFNFIGNMIPFGSAGNFLLNLSMDSHYQSLSRGVIDSRDLIYFLSIISIFLLLAELNLTKGNLLSRITGSSNLENLGRNKRLALIFGLVLTVITILNVLYFSLAETDVAVVIAIIVFLFVSRIFSTILCIRISLVLNRRYQEWGIFGFLFPQVTLIILSFMNTKME